MYYLYILQSYKDHNFYIGVTNNLNRRFTEHNNGLSKSTKSRRPFKLIHSEAFADIKKAYQREKYFKGIKKQSQVLKIISSAG